MDLKLYPGKLRGSVTMPPSKSLHHRVLIASALSGRMPYCTNDMGDDVRNTCLGLQTLLSGSDVPIDCGESGTTLRLLLPLAMTMRDETCFCGTERLLSRPMPPYAAIAQEGDHIRVTGRLTAGEYRISGRLPSQFISGLLFALPLLTGDSTIVLTEPLDSLGYINMTLQVLERFGIVVEEAGCGYRVPGGQRYRYAEMPIEGDWSAASNFFVANALGSEITVNGVETPSVQADSLVARLVEEGLPKWLDVADVPDSVPALVLLAALTPGHTTVLHHAGRSRIKELNRLRSMSKALKPLGGTVMYTGESLFVFGREILAGGEVDTLCDHRIAMMAAIAATRSADSVIIHGAECVSKSYPAFWNDLRTLGMRIEEL